MKGRKGSSGFSTTPADAFTLAILLFSLFSSIRGGNEGQIPSAVEMLHRTANVFKMPQYIQDVTPMMQIPHNIPRRCRDVDRYGRLATAQEVDFQEQARNKKAAPTVLGFPFAAAH